MYIIQYKIAISETNAFYLKRVIKISPPNKKRTAVGNIMNTVHTNLAIFKYLPHYNLI